MSKPDGEIIHELLTLIPGQTCKHCKRPFTPARVGRPAKFCSSGCRVAHWRARRKTSTRVEKQGRAGNGSHKA